jgi:hypothetical protein
VALTGFILQHTRESTVDVESSIEVDGCENVSITGCQVLGARGRGVRLKESRMVRISDCTIRPRKGDMAYRAAVVVDGGSAPVQVVNNFLAKGSDGDASLAPGDGRHATGNITI